ncbi:Rick_17kDa_Anti domain-containing protein [Vibrio chagasii]|uniref:glycine zipper 2TM domain-containing protein n=1 Tax=Vibrio TaxID=662 RepID=UPI00076A4D50|nr:MULTISPECIES: glycine zipper 2TM domain-containing protein [Vibrio]MCG9560062.1 glycine zipper 2TM domain-containing protein [Vibrio chagasii]MCG9567334.1 glycine zipper 2TM domain-containing protein [Vibrio chagasii]CAH6782339.1 Rick_17kDa_Anti domain-containing protein [Vibrio chagasii]CAH6838957.1 Glycine zipper 2TM domain-containing protein [Vibrio chagasii]CAH6843469.1 Rick_17kDa_Anti domain-containing protein [Vibrio chagasii]
MKIKAVVMAATTVVTLSACKEEASAPTLANITLVEAATKSVKTPHQVCHNVLVTRQAEVKDEAKIIGTIGGAAAGAALGNQVGGGSGKTIATAVGTVAGAMTGRKIQDNAQKNDTITTTEQRCSTEYTTSTQVDGYDVTYEIGGTSTTVRLAKKPTTNTFPIVSGQVVLPQ